MAKGLVGLQDRVLPARKESNMRPSTKALLVGAAALTLASASASAAVICNDDGDCWHVRGRADYRPELRLHIYPDDWEWRETEHYRWREHEGYGYWRSGAWIDLD